MISNVVLLRYHEIAIKGRNRRMFEDKLADQVRRLLKDIPGVAVTRERGRMLVQRKQWAEFTAAEETIIRQQLKKCFGLESFSMCRAVEPELETIEKEVLSVFGDYYQAYAAQHPGEAPISYCMRARRSFKKFPMNSKELEIYFAEKIMPHYPRLKVDLMNAELVVGLEVRESRAFIYFDSERALGGLPVGSTGPMLALLSGGIDSPVACFQAMKRGCTVSFLTFHSFPYTPMDSVEKVGRLVEIINGYQKKQPYYSCNLAEAQKSVRDNCKPRFRTILYRRMMMRIASIMAEFTKSKALLTGESLGQVASQTLDNMHVINSSTKQLIVRPLVGFDKNEAIDLARKYGTMEVSQVECADSCTVFAPDSPATSAKLHYIEYDEKNLDMVDLLRKSLATIRRIEPSTGEEYEMLELQKWVDSLSDEQLTALY